MQLEMGVMPSIGHKGSLNSLIEIDINYMLWPLLSPDLIGLTSGEHLWECGSSVRDCTLTSIKQTPNMEISFGKMMFILQKSSETCRIIAIVKLVVFTWFKTVLGLDTAFEYIIRTVMLLWCKLFVELMICTDGFLTLCMLMGIWRTILSVRVHLRS